MLKLFYDNVCIAEVHGTEGKYYLELRPGVKEFFIPRILFKRGQTRVPMIDFVHWMSDRVFPEDRVDAKKLLSEIGLKEYLPFAIAKDTKASLIGDGWWVSFSDEDNFRDSTIRGAAGFPEWPEESVFQANQQAVLKARGSLTEEQLKGIEESVKESREGWD
ncbi:hypothetical protein [Paenibacillus jiagnxiensis]|uniref:hypothetical protein n=1 Tax=Paenibacillus jiagnxiensis TaxID=3228926 RepID=UPI0033B3A6BA